MQLADIVSAVSSVGIGVACAIFVLWLSYYMITKVVTVMDDTQKTMVSVKDALINLTSRVDKIEERINSKGDGE